MSGLFGEARKVSMHAGNPGQYRIRMTVTMSRGRSLLLVVPVVSVPKDPIVTIRGDGEPVTIELSPDEEHLRRIVSGER